MNRQIAILDIVKFVVRCHILKLYKV